MVVAFLILLVVGVYVLVYYQHPDDHNDAYFPKLVVILGFVVAGATVLLLPLDVANREGYAGTYARVLVLTKTNLDRLFLDCGALTFASD
jgi:LMBR1-like membrane protein